MKYSLVFLSFTILININVSGQELVTDRPDQTESATIVPQYHLQWEAGSQYDEYNSGSEWTLLTNLFRYGVSDKLEFRLVTEIISAPKAGFDNYKLGTADIQIGLKYALLKGPVEIAYMGHLVAPNGSIHTTFDAWGTVNRINIAHNFSENISSSYNFGYELFEEGSNGDFIYTWALGFALTEKLGFYIELFGAYEEFESWTSNFSSGFAYLYKDNLQFDFSIGSGITDRSNYYNLGFSWRIPY